MENIKEYEQIVAQNERHMSLEAYWRLCCQKWRWFLWSTVCTVIIAILFLLTAVPVYERSAEVIIKDENNQGGLLSAAAANLGMFAGLGLFNVSSNVTNEIEAMQTPYAMMEVVNRLDLDIKYQHYEGLRKMELWGDSLPVKVTFPKLTDTDYAYFKMDLKSDGTFKLYKFRLNEDRLEGEMTGKVNTVCQTPLGMIAVTSTKSFDHCLKGDGQMTIRVTKNPKYNQVEACLKKLEVELADDQSSVISITYEDAYSKRAELVINTLISVYEEEWMRDKNSAAIASSRFIDERIHSIEEELGNLDGNISTFKSENLIPDYEETAKFYMENAATTYENVQKLQNELYVMEHMQKLMHGNTKSNEVLPANVLPDNENVALQIVEYNKLVLKRNQLAETSSDRNPLVESLDQQLTQMRSGIAEALDHTVDQMRILVKNANKEKSDINSLIASAPSKMKQILPAERQHKVIEALYIFMLQKREENGISQIFTSKNTRIISPPMGKLKPVFPKKMRTMAAALLLGLLLPAVFLFIRESRRIER